MPGEGGECIDNVCETSAESINNVCGTYAASINNVRDVDVRRVYK